MITLVSYPRSGNTFLRNVLFEVYGISSSTYHHEAHGPDANWQLSQVVKTHLLPHQLPQELLHRPIVYLIRDGRDACVSLAYHKKDIFDKSSDYVENLMEVVYASESSFFGGWSQHVLDWRKHADIVIRFEDLIQDPITECEKLASLINLQAPKLDRLPDFESLKKGEPEYGSGKHLKGENLAPQWFRRGKVGAYREEMPIPLQDLFWHLHGEALQFMGYGDTTLNWPSVDKPPSILIEASKLDDLHVDGIKRYVQELIKAALMYSYPDHSIAALINGEVYPLNEAVERGHSEAALPTTGIIDMIKESLRTVLPSRLYHTLVKQVPVRFVKQRLVRLRQKSKKDGSIKTKDYDAVLLTLPQHYRDLGNVNFKKLVGVVHDLTHRSLSELHDNNNVKLAETGLFELHHSHATIIAVSKATSRKLKDIGMRSEVIYEGVDRKRFYPIQNAHLKALVRKRYALPSQNFFLSVSTLEPRKNIGRLIEAYAKLDQTSREKTHLVLAGKKGWKWKSIDIPDHCKSQVHFTGYIEEEHLAALYTLAKGFVYISMEEGFGLPVLEAMACATPVMVSDRSSLPELAGEHAFYCSPDDERSIQLCLESMISAHDLTDRGYKLMKRSWQFSWMECWKKTLEVLLTQKEE